MPVLVFGFAGRPGQVQHLGRDIPPHRSVGNESASRPRVRGMSAAAIADLSVGSMLLQQETWYHRAHTGVFFTSLGSPRTPAPLAPALSRPEQLIPNVAFQAHRFSTLVC
ncbi:hypothetical protein NDU88_007118 [Pleurodeles waltl]|uniref:Uncharacterized protein n=1 Tax=Pleurodeles waltl TaxID=8319 RepID=A0AAV7RPE0_PLEWA|nr:hypothetical protein NDU88_007118 [Pleurodeles waltl]